jgi:signal peptidase I
MKEFLRQNRGFIIFLLGLGVFRTAIADWNPIPSGSMRPTLLEGDVVLVNRVAYDLKLPLTDLSVARLGEPQRGDVVTFSSPVDGTRLIKRIVGVPGDVIEMRADLLIVNGVSAKLADLVTIEEPLDAAKGPASSTTEAVRGTEQLSGATHPVQFMPQVPSRRDIGAFTVGPDEFFMLGDSRNNSVDSRYIGTVPRHLIIGRAHRILVSGDTHQWTLRTTRVLQKL